MTQPILYPRMIETRITEALTDTPVVLVAGPRQAGKTTLVRQMATEGMRYLTLDDESTLLSAQADPVGMVRSLDMAIIDEIQRAPELLLAIKRSVDEDRRPGRFLLTGSANIMALPTVADSLAGRMETLTLLPLSQSELYGKTANWIDSAFDGKLTNVSEQVVGDALVETVLCGGYPEAITRTSARRRSAWARQYIDAIVQRDVRDVAAIDKLDQLPRFMRSLAQVSGHMCNYTQLGGQVGLDSKTAARYLGILEQMYLLKRVEVCTGNRLKRIIKTPKMQFIDSGVLAALRNLGSAEVRQDHSRFGAVLETFVYGELLKHMSVAADDYQILYYRDIDTFEVDLVIENPAGELVGVEIKASATIKAVHSRGLRKLASLAGKKFKMGVILYDGTETLPLGDHIWAAPLSTLWGQ